MKTVMFDYFDQLKKNTLKKVKKEGVPMEYISVSVNTILVAIEENMGPRVRARP